MNRPSLECIRDFLNWLGVEDYDLADDSADDATLACVQLVCAVIANPGCLTVQ